VSVVVDDEELLIQYLISENVLESSDLPLSGSVWVFNELLLRVCEKVLIS
jgi:hypothetical protein